MNGRCETDPLDKAVDVCDRCYGEFCDSHLLHPKGRKHPLCSECALMASGVRGSSKVVYRGARKTAKKRRKELQEATESAEAHVFEFFDHDTSSSEGSTVKVDDTAEESDELTDDDDIPIPDPTEVNPTAQQTEDTNAQSVDETPPTPAVAKLEQLRKAAEAQSDADDGSLIEPPPGSMTSASVLGDDIPAELLERRRSFGSEHSTSKPDTGEDGLAALPNRQSTRPPVAPPPERAPTPAIVASSETNEPSSRKLPAAEDRRRPTPPPTHRRTTAPMIGEVRNVAGRRSADTPTETETTQPAARVNQSARAGAIVPDGALNAVDVFDADHQRAPEPEAEPDTTEPQQVAEPTDSGRADVDSQGNWIPPVLRGIAPDAAEAKANLPQRPRR